ncbi:MAG: hypothetical protein GXP48_03310 [Acidobacteria bacterium]|nr:hypothetical protein [Acidobacteriota bacterium]
MKRLAQVFILLTLVAGMVACGGNSTLNDTEAAVYLQAEVKKYTPDVHMSTIGGDVTIDHLIIHSFSKDPNATLNANQDVHLTRWVVTSERADGGTKVSPQWVNTVDVYVPAGGSADLENYRVFPEEYFHQAPLSYLFPENGGIDPETGNTNIRQTLNIELFGRTASGKSVSVAFSVTFNFMY